MWRWRKREMNGEAVYEGGTMEGRVKTLDEMVRVAEERMRYPYLCGECLGVGMVVDMQQHAKETKCRMCAVLFYPLSWRVGANERSTLICVDCGCSRNLCQSCLLDIHLKITPAMRRMIASCAKPHIGRKAHLDDLKLEGQCTVMSSQKLVLTNVSFLLSEEDIVSILSDYSVSNVMYSREKEMMVVSFRCDADAELCAKQYGKSLVVNGLKCDLALVEGEDMM